MTLQQVHTPAEFTIEPGETCLTALMDTAKKRPHGVMFTRPANYEWVNVTGKEFIDEVFEVAQGLIELGVEQGDRIALISATRYEWSLLDYAIWAAGAASGNAWCDRSNHSPLRHARNCSFIVTATTVPDTTESAPAVAMAVTGPKKSAMIPAERAPTA